MSFVDSVRRVGPGDRDAVTATLAAAFSAGPVTEWLVPDVAVRGTVVEAMAQAEFGPALDAGLIDATADFAGAGVWYLEPGHAHGSDPDQDASALITLFGVDIASRVVTLNAAVRHLLPDGGAAVLAYLGVLPDRQRLGIGSLLLAHRHAVLDADGMDAALVATSAGSARLYRRHGYHVTGEADLPRGPRLWAMHRPACAGAGAGGGRG